MKNLYNIMVLMLIFSFSAFAQVNSNIYNCGSNFLGDYSQDSVSYKISDDVLESDFLKSPIEYSKESIRKLSSKLSNKSGFICNLNIKKVGCREIIEGLLESKACYVESDIGYFIISRDMLDNSNIVFNRFD